jgi:hypothetical protein
MRTITIALAAASLFSPLASARASAGDQGGHHGGQGNHPGGGGGGGGAPEARIDGSGQRLHFTFGGSVRLRGNKAKGRFVLLVHPLAPQGNTLAVACRYTKFSEVTITAESASFRGAGKCERLLTDGTLEVVDAVNVFQIVNGTTTDSIDVNFVGATGVAVPGGALEFGDFSFTPAS